MRLNNRSLLKLGLALSIGFAAACSDDNNPVAPEPPPVPGGLVASPLGPSMVRVSWSAVSGATGYVVERAPGASGGTFTQVATPSDTSFDDEGVSASSTFRYRVAATGVGGTSSFSGEAVVNTPEEGPKAATISADITSDRTLYADTVYQLSGFIKVANGATLTIQPGTKIVGDYDIPGSSLFILRGSRIDAQGTKENPIVLTSERPLGQRQPGDWGGLIIIGNGITNRGSPTYIEGTGTDAQKNPLQDYSGGTDNNDSSGTLRYVRIEFAGFPTAPNEELNSLTMAAVGRGTTIEYVQVLLGLDDSFEWFGGAVDARYLVSYESADDHFDASEGFVGRVQHMIAFQSIRPEPRPNLAGGAASDPQGIENDGCWAENCLAGNDNRSASQPYTVPVFANFTLVGAPQGAWETPSGNIGMMLRRGTGGLYVNGVVARYSRASVSIRGEQTKARLDAGLMALRNTYFTQSPVIFQTGTGTGESAQFALDLTANSLEDGNAATASLFSAFPTDTREATAASFDWTPAGGSPIATGGLVDFSGLPEALRNAAGTFVTPTAYRGAAAPGGVKWWEGWTHYARF
jgi:hypothetical protein